MDADGYVWIVARRRDLIVRGGYNIAPVEIEQALRRHPGIAEAAVFGVAGAAADPAVACAIVPERNRACPTARDVRAWVRDHVADYAVPRYVEVVDTIPLTPIGKVNRRALTDAALGRLGAS
jgi:long-chain acyl-CoA synthetase